MYEIKILLNLKKIQNSKQISIAGNDNEVKNKVDTYFNNQIEINKKDFEKIRQFIQDLTVRESVKNGTKIDV